MHSPTPPLRLIIEPRDIMRPLLRGHMKWRASHSVMFNSLLPHGLWPSRLLSPWNSPGKNTGVRCHSLLQGIFPTQGWNLGLLHCRQILYHLNHQGSPNSEEVLAFNLDQFVRHQFMSPSWLSFAYYGIRFIPTDSEGFHTVHWQHLCLNKGRWSTVCSQFK